MSLAERIGLPASPLSAELRVSPTGELTGNRANSPLPHHPSLPPKPASSNESLKSSSARSSSNMSSSSTRVSDSWKDAKVISSNEAVNVSIQEEENIGAKEDDHAHARIVKAESDKQPVADEQKPAPQTVVEPPTPLDERPHITTPLRNPFGNFARSRADRPHSTDMTPRDRSEHSFYKTHNTRNHSVPNSARLRAPHSTRPIVSLDALQRINKALSPTPPRRDSPAPSAVSAAD